MPVLSQGPTPPQGSSGSYTFPGKHHPASPVGACGPVRVPLTAVPSSRCGYMIDNVILLVSGALQKKSVRDLLGRCHPLGRFSEMEAVNIADTPSDLFHAVLVETPLGTNVGRCSLPVQSLPLGSVPPWHCVGRVLGVGGPEEPSDPALLPQPDRTPLWSPRWGHREGAAQLQHHPPCPTRQAPQALLLVEPSLLRCSLESAPPLPCSRWSALASGGRGCRAPRSPSALKAQRCHRRCPRVVVRRSAQERCPADHLAKIVAILDKSFREKCMCHQVPGAAVQVPGGRGLAWTP